MGRYSLYRPLLARTGPTDVKILAGLIGHDLTRQLEACGATQAPQKPRQPILLRPGGSPWEDGNLALRTISHRAESTVDSYAGKLLRFLEWSLIYGVDPRDANLIDILEFRRFRIEEDLIQRSTWSGDVAALSLLYKTYVMDGVIDHEPWSTIRDIRQNVGAHVIRSIGREDYLRFRDVGLSGYHLDGSLDPHFEVVTPLRNALYCDLMVTTGLRRVEASHLTLLDLPELSPGDFFGIGDLPGQICKFNKPRKWKVSRSWIKRLRSYHQSEWVDTVRTAQPALRRLEKASKLIRVKAFDGHSITTDRGKKKLRNLSREQRLVLVMDAELAERYDLTIPDDKWIVPASLFPGTRMPSVSPDGWSTVFRVANVRLEELLMQAGRRPVRRVTPHMLRHSFAVNYLRGRLDEMRVENPSRNKNFITLRTQMMHPLLDLMHLLGHSTIKATLGYLREISQNDPAHLSSQKSWITSFLEVTK